MLSEKIRSSSLFSLSIIDIIHYTQYMRIKYYDKFKKL